MERVVSALIAACVLGAIGYFLGQYVPLSDNPFQVVAEPYGLLRNQQAVFCTLIGALIGGILGLMVEGGRKR